MKTLDSLSAGQRTELLEPHSRAGLADLALAARELARINRRTLLALPATLTILAAVAVMLLPRLWRSEASFIVDHAASGPLPASVMGMLGQLAGTTDDDSPQFYADLVVSPPVLDSLLLSRPHATCSASDSGRLIARLDPGGKTLPEKLFYGRKLLAERIETRVSLRTGVVDVGLEAGCPSLSQELLTSLLDQVNAFNVVKRQTRVRQRRQFVEEQLAQAEGRLRAAETDIASFLDRNRSIASPQLRVEEERLQRKVDMQSEIASTLRREYELARIEEINGTAALTVISPPSLPIEASKPKRRLVVVLSAFAALLVTATVVLVRAVIAPPLEVASPSLRNRLNGVRARLGLPLAS